MRFRTLPQAAALAAALAVITTTAATADALKADGDRLTPVVDGVVHLGEFPSGAVIEVDVAFVLECSGSWHVDANQQVILEPDGAFVPPGGDVVMTGATFPAPGSGWPADGEPCPATPDPIVGANRATATLTAPTADGRNYEYFLTWAREITPAAAFDWLALSGGTAVTFRLDVVSNTPPTLDVPADFTVEADAPGGWVAEWHATATDGEDEFDPTPTCAPAVGTILALGTTTVTCSAEDSKGLSVTRSFSVTVVDTRPPELSDVPTGLRLATNDLAGATLDYPLPTASDVADPEPQLACDPAAGDRVSVGRSVVTCTVTDASGNVAQAAFAVEVELWALAWLDPVSDAGGALAVQSGRTVPLRMLAWRDGTEVTTGSASVRVLPCTADEPVTTTALAWAGAERWTGRLDTSGLDGGCYRGVVAFDGFDVGGFDLMIRGAAAPARVAASH